MVVVMKERASEEQFQRVVITTEAGNHRGKHFLTAHFVKVNKVACLLCQLRTKGPLSTAISFAERVSRIDLAHVISQSLDEDCWLESAQKIFAGYFGKLLTEIGFDPPTVTEVAIAFTDINSTQLPCPVVHILKQVMVDGLQVGKIKSPRNWVLNQFQQTDCRCIGFESIQRYLIAQACLVPQDFSARKSVAVRSVVPRHADSLHWQAVYRQRFPRQGSFAAP